MSTQKKKQNDSNTDFYSSLPKSILKMLDDTTYSKKTFLRLISLFALLNINIDSFCENANKIISDFSDDKSSIRKKFFYDPLRYENNYASIKTIYFYLPKYLIEHAPIACNESFQVAINNFVKSIINDSECQLVFDYSKYLDLFDQFFKTSYRILLEGNGVSDASNISNKNFTFSPSERFYTYTRLKAYGFNLPNEKFLCDFPYDPLNGISDQKDIILESFQKTYVLSHPIIDLLSWFMKNWDFMDKLAANPFLVDRLFLLLNNQTILETNELASAESLRQKQPDLIFRNSVRYGFLLNCNIEKGSRVKIDVLLKFFSKKYDENIETMLLCHRLFLSFKFIKNPNLFFNQLFFYALSRDEYA